MKSIIWHLEMCAKIKFINKKPCLNIDTLHFLYYGCLTEWHIADPGVLLCNHLYRLLRLTRHHDQILTQEG